MKNQITALMIALVVLSLSACTSNQSKKTSDSLATLPIDSVKAIAKEAYFYAYPMVDAYRIEYAYFIDKTNPEYKGLPNKLINMAHVFTPQDKAVQTPNSDTPYSMAGLDLRTEPMLLTVPKIEETRYFSFQLVDLYTHNFDYIGSHY